MEREPWLRRGMRALVTGASSGIGLAIARALSREGVSVIGLSRTAPAGNGDGPAAPGRASDAAPVHLSCDVRNPSEVGQAVAEAMRIAGELDILVNAAGVSMPALLDVEKIDIELWRRVVETNLTGLFLVTREALPHLEQNGGYIINILSTAAYRANAGNAAYSASKQGARAVGEAVAAEAKESGVRVTSISPGPVNTNIWNHKNVPPTEETRGRMLASEDIADIALFLLKAPAYVSIDNITVTPFYC